MTGIVLLVIIVVLALFLVGLYNNLVKLRNRFKNAFAQIDVQLRRRYDLIPNLVETAKAYIKHERETLEAVIAARNQADSAREKAADQPGDVGAMKGLMGAEMLLGGALGRLFAVSEAYPDLKANQNFLALQEELTATEGRVAYARQFYNDSVLSYNNKLQTFPTVVIASMFNFEKREYFEADEASREVPKVEF